MRNQSPLRWPLLGNGYIECFAHKHAYVHTFACKAGHAQATIVPRPYFVPVKAMPYIVSPLVIRDTGPQLGKYVVKVKSIVYKVCAVGKSGR